MSAASSDSKAIEVFYSYAREDEQLRDKLVAHLSALRQMGYIVEWHDRMIPPGVEFDPEIARRLEASRIILLLISAYFTNSTYIYHVELKRALEKHRAGAARAIPVILRPCIWHTFKVRDAQQNLPSLGELNALPTDGEPVTSKKWDSEEAALTNVAEGIQNTVFGMLDELYPDDEPEEPPTPPPPGTKEIIYQAALDLDERPRPSLLKAILAHLRAFARDPHLTLLEQKKGSLVLVLRGSSDGFHRLSEMFAGGALTHLFGFKLLDVKDVSDEDQTGGNVGGAPGVMFTEVGDEEERDFDAGEIEARAQAAEERGDFDAARRLYRRGAQAALARRDNFAYAAFLNGLGIIEKKARRFDLARVCFNSALKTFEQLHAHDAVEILRENLEELDRLEKSAAEDADPASGLMYDEA